MEEIRLAEKNHFLPERQHPTFNLKQAKQDEVAVFKEYKNKTRLFQIFLNGKDEEVEELRMILDSDPKRYL